jgi:hypothetical protein
VGPAFVSVVGKVLDSAFTVVDRAQRDSPVLEQMTLPQRHGGLSLRSTSLLEGRAAYRSAAARAQQAMSNGSAEFRPIEGPSFEGVSGGDKLWLLRKGLHGDGNGLWEVDGEAPDVAIMPAIAQAQRDYRRHIAASGMRRCRHHVLLRVPTSCAPWRACAAVHACHSSAAWMTALPTTHALALKTEEFCAAMKSPLGLAPLPANAVDLRFGCRAPSTAADCDHALVCTSVQGQAKQDVEKRCVYNRLESNGFPLPPFSM